MNGWLWFLLIYLFCMVLIQWVTWEVANLPNRETLNKHEKALIGRVSFVPILNVILVIVMLGSVVLAALGADDNDNSSK